MSKYSVRYVHKIAPSTNDTGPDVEIPNGAFSDSKTLASVLRAAGVLASGARVATFRVEGDKTIVFPFLPGSTTYWHAVILGPVAVQESPKASITPEFENQCLSIGREFLPAVAIQVLENGGTNSPEEQAEYEAWLRSQLEAS